jgi:hypothetical protein
LSLSHLPSILATLLALVVLLAWLRLLLWQRAAPAGQRSRGWRLAALLALQPLCAALLYFTLLPPTLPGEAGTLVVATAGATAAQARGVGAADNLVALPEAGDIADAQRLPDLSTALRRHPGTRRLRVIGAGLEARDLDAARGLSIAFEPPALPAGVVRLDPPARVAPGGTFQVGGRVHGNEGGSVELLDPAGQRVDMFKPGQDGEFSLRGSARVAGLSTFTLRVRDAARKPVEDLTVPLWTAADPAPRVLVLAGAPGPELKFLRRWATDAGIDAHVQASLGGGLQLGDAPLALNAGTLGEFDLVIVDDRSWATLGAGQRAALGEAVGGGLGLLLRVTGPLPQSTRAQWQALGLALAGGGDSAAVKLDARAVDGDAMRALRGPGTREVPIATAADASPPPELSRRVVRVDPAQAAPLVRAADGTVLAHWRASGRGRLGVWTLADSYLLPLAGRHDLHAQLWSETFTALARPAADAAPGFSRPMRIDRRITLCGLAGQPQVQAPDGASTALLIDPATGGDACAGYWPVQAGWHQLQQGQDTWAFHVSARDAAPGLRAVALQDATLQLAQQAASAPATAHTAAAPARRGSPWPWFFGWLLATAALWRLERARFGRMVPAGAIP